MKYGVGDTPADNSRYGKKYQYPQFSTNAHPSIPPPSMAPQKAPIITQQYQWCNASKNSNKY